MKRKSLGPCALTGRRLGPKTEAVLVLGHNQKWFVSRTELNLRIKAETGRSAFPGYNRRGKELGCPTVMGVVELHQIARTDDYDPILMEAIFGEAIARHLGQMAEKLNRLRLRRSLDGGVAAVIPDVASKRITRGASHHLRQTARVLSGRARHPTEH